MEHIKDRLPLRIHRSYPREIIVDKNGIVVTEVQTLEVAEFIVASCNASEPDGIVSKLVGLLSEIDGYLNGSTMELPKGVRPINKVCTDSIFHAQIKLVLAEAKESMK